MRLPSVLAKTVRDLRWQVFWYGAGIALMGVLVVYIYPSYKAQLADFQIPEALKAFVGSADYTSPEGFLTAEFFSWTPILLVIFAIMAGTSALAGEEANGTLDLLLSQPISRRRLALEKMAGFAASSVVVAAIICIGWPISVPFVDISIDWGRLLIATFNLIPLTLFFGVLAMWAGAALSNRRAATGLVTAVAVVTYFVNYLAALVDVLKPLRWLSPFHYYNGTNILSAGIDWPKLAVLIVLIVLFAVLTVVAFERRDVGVRTSGLRLPRLRPARA